MLTRELLNYRCRGDAVKLEFPDKEDPAVKNTAEALCGIWRRALAEHWTRGRLEEHLEPTLKGDRKPLLAAGLHKILHDHAEWRSGAESFDYPGARRQLFLASAQALAECGGDYERFRELLQAQHGAFLLEGVYPDLPENEQLQSLTITQADELIARYRLSMVQSLLLYVQEMELLIAAESVRDLRRFFQYLKFFRLLAEVEPVKPAPKTAGRRTVMRLKITGPLAVFGETRKYGLQMASFFPAVVNLPWWRLSATLKIKERTVRLKLSEEADLQGHYRSFATYTPEEFSMFAELFRAKAEAWKLVDEVPFISVPPAVIVPDFLFAARDGGEQIPVELFHRWHATALPGRLTLLEKHPEINLLLGIDRALLSDGGVEALVERHPALAGRIFTFRDFPGVDRVRRQLEAWRSASRP